MPFDIRDFPAPPDAVRVQRNRRLVALWLFAISGMIFVMVALGGVTRLTGSGLSIMEWAPVSGILPPLSHADWMRLFDLYKQIPQYRLVNEGMSLAGFQQIFWLEWVHRLWGRLIGVVLVLPLIWFWLRGAIDRWLGWRLLGLFVLGGLQGAVGWFMVESGFLPDSTAVSAARLVVHLVLALILYAAVLWTALSVLHPTSRPLPGAAVVRRLASMMCGLISLTIIAGGFTAGLHAGLAYNTFPLMDGRLIPESYARLTPFVRNLTQNISTVQFDHRLIATLTLLGAAAFVAAGLRTRLPTLPRRAVVAVGLAAAAQYCLGVATLLLVVPVPLAATHQCVAVLTLTAVLVARHALRGASAR
jgi:cytochrome c oxidase assembly protein subunit 15